MQMRVQYFVFWISVLSATLLPLVSTLNRSNKSEEPNLATKTSTPASRTSGDSQNPKQLVLCDNNQTKHRQSLGCARPPSIQLTGSTSPAASPGLITKTTDAIHRVLSGAFHFFDDEQESNKTDIERVKVTNNTTTKPNKPIKSTNSKSKSSKYQETKKRNEDVETTTSQPMPPTTTKQNMIRDMNDTLRLPMKNDLAQVNTGQNVTNELMRILIGALNSLSISRAEMQSAKARNIRLADLDAEYRSSKLQSFHNETLKLDSENVHLLCKLLHDKLLTNSSNLAITTAQPNISNEIVTTKKPGRQTSSEIPIRGNGSKANRDETSGGEETTKQPRILFVESESEVNEQDNGPWLMQSISRIPSNRMTNHEAILAVKESLQTLFELSWQSNPTRPRGKPEFRTRIKKATNFDYENGDMNERDDPSTTEKPAITSDNENFKIRLSAEFTSFSRDQLIFVFFLMQRVKLGSGQQLWKVLSFEEADRLLDKLEHLEISRQFERRHVRPMVLLEPFMGRTKSINSPENDPKSWPPELNVPDESLHPNRQQTNTQQQSSSFFDRFTRSSFTDHLFLYTILIIIILFLFAVCCSIPMLCKSGSRDIQKLTGPKLPVPSKEAMSIGSNGGDAIWRKLSNTTTTLSRDQDQRLKIHEANIDPLRRERLMSQSGEKPVKPMEWYTLEEDKMIEEKQERRRLAHPDGRQDDVLVVRDKRRISKSVQTSNHRPATDWIKDTSGYEGARNSNTLTKSELVMLKEKLVPIANQTRLVQSQPQHHRRSSGHRQVASQTSDPLNMDSELEMDATLSRPFRKSEEPLYLNRQPQFLVPENQGSPETPSKYIDDSLNSLGVKFELPAKSQVQVNAIKDELSRLEKLDQEQRCNATRENHCSTDLARRI